MSAWKHTSTLNFCSRCISSNWHLPLVGQLELCPCAYLHPQPWPSLWPSVSASLELYLRAVPLRLRLHHLGSRLCPPCRPPPRCPSRQHPRRCPRPASPTSARPDKLSTPQGCPASPVAVHKPGLLTTCELATTRCCKACRGATWLGQSRAERSNMASPLWWEPSLEIIGCYVRHYAMAAMVFDAVRPMQCEHVL